MTVYVDELLRWPNAKGKFLGGSCHLTADTLNELHRLAARIGMRRAWFQDHPLAPHYDLIASKRDAAIAAGAVFVPGKEQARRRRARREAMSPIGDAPPVSSSGDIAG